MRLFGKVKVPPLAHIRQLIIVDNLGVLLNSNTRNIGRRCCQINVTIICLRTNVINILERNITSRVLRKSTNYIPYKIIVNIQIAHSVGVAYIQLVVTTRLKTTWPSICSTQNAANYVAFIISKFKGTQRAKVISIGNTHIFNFTAALIATVQIYRANNTAYLAIRIALVIYSNITGVENVFQIATVPIAGNTANYVVAIINFAVVIAFFDNAAQTADNAADMASIRSVAAVTNRTLIIGIVNDNATAGLFGTVTQNTAHINRCRTLCIKTCCLNIAYIIGSRNTAIIGKATNAADIGITLNITCIIAAGNYCISITAITGSTGITLDDIKSLFISQNVTITVRCLRHVNFTDNTADIGSLCCSLRRIRLGMHITAVAAGFNTHRCTVQIACYAANITGDIFFIILGVVIITGDFISKATILFDATGSHNVTAVVNSI